MNLAWEMKHAYTSCWRKTVLKVTKKLLGRLLKELLLDAEKKATYLHFLFSQNELSQTFGIYQRGGYGDSHFFDGVIHWNTVPAIRPTYTTFLPVRHVRSKAHHIVTLQHSVRQIVELFQLPLVFEEDGLPGSKLS